MWRLFWLLFATINCMVYGCEGSWFFGSSSPLVPKTKVENLQKALMAPMAPMAPTAPVAPAAPKLPPLNPEVIKPLDFDNWVWYIQHRTRDNRIFIVPHCRGASVLIDGRCVMIKLW
eukprot:01797.XXX_2162_2575_1 [CDS] Oithona nana genome sequencing.